jgi:RimJ/RimL family protein N-acetyltransferase
MSSYQSYETERLIVRSTTSEDAEFLLTIFNSPKWLQFIGDRNVHTIEEAEKYIEDRITSQYKRLGYGHYIVELKTNGAKIGTCGLYDRPGLDGIDIGFAFLPEYEGKGYAYESAEVVKNAAFNEFSIPELVAITTKDNFASQKLLEKLGLENQGDIQMPGEEEALFFYKMRKP